MKILTDNFDRDKKIKLIDCNPKRTSRKAIKRKVVLISQSTSNWTQGYKSEIDDYVGFYTEFNLYRSKKEYLLQIVGVSDHPSFYPPKPKVIRFSEPRECMDIIENPHNNDLYLSDPVLELLDKIQNSDYLTSWEKAQWEKCLIDEEDDIE